MCSLYSHSQYFGTRTKIGFLLFSDIHKQVSSLLGCFAEGIVRRLTLAPIVYPSVDYNNTGLA